MLWLTSGRGRTGKRARRQHNGAGKASNVARSSTRARRRANLVGGHQRGQIYLARLNFDLQAAGQSATKTSDDLSPFYSLLKSNNSPLPERQNDERPQEKLVPSCLPLSRLFPVCPFLSLFLSVASCLRFCFCSCSHMIITKWKPFKMINSLSRSPCPSHFFAHFERLHSCSIIAIIAS